MPATLFVSQKKKKLPLWVLKASSIFGLKSSNFGTCIWTCSVHYPPPQPLFAIRKIVSVTYALQAGVSSDFRGEDNIPLLQTQRQLVSKVIKTQINVWKIPLKKLKYKMFKHGVNGASRDRGNRASSACVACPDGSPLVWDYCLCRIAIRSKYLCFARLFLINEAWSSNFVVWNKICHKEHAARRLEKLSNVCFIICIISSM